MSSIADNELLTKISRLPDKVKAEVIEYIENRLESEDVASAKGLEFGWATECGFTMKMSDDFDESLEEFKVYM